MTLKQALEQAFQHGLDRLEASLLMLHVLGVKQGRAWLLSHDQDPLSNEALAAFQGLVQRRLAGEPVAYLTGERGFFGLSLQVDARVLDPRPDTETLVEWALECLESSAFEDSKQEAPAETQAHEQTTSSKRSPQVLDLGTGSGAIALAIQHQCLLAQVSAVDASPEALAVAKHNEARLRAAVPTPAAPVLPIHFYQGSWFEPLAGLQFDLIVSNPPYLAEGDAHLPALKFEPLNALVSGPEGLDDLRHLIRHAPNHLKPGAWLLLEHGWDQAQKVRELLSSAGFLDVKSRKDLAGIERCSGGFWPNSR